MTSKEETEFTERLARQFVLVPRDRFFHFVGGAAAIVVVAIGINVGSVMAFLKSSTAAKAQADIEAIKGEVAKTQAEVKATKEKAARDQAEIETIKATARARLGDLDFRTYVRTDQRYHIQAEDGQFGLFISNSKVFNGANVVVAKGRAWTWQLVPVAQ